MVSTPMDVLVLVLGVATILGLISISFYEEWWRSKIKHTCYGPLIPIVLFFLLLMSYQIVAKIFGVDVIS